MQNYKTITTSLNSAGVAELVLNRAEVHNAFDDSMIGELIDALKTLAANPAVRVLLLKSLGKNFSAGADLNWMRSMAEKNYQQNLEDAGQLAELMRQLDCFPAPTIALVQGAAFGGALGLVSCCDIAIAEQGASFCLSEVKIGLIPAVISPYVMRAIGERASRRYFLTAERFDASTALNLGLVHQLVDAGGLSGAAEHFVGTLLNNSPAALRSAKELMAVVNNQPINQQLIDSTSERIASIRVSVEGQEGLTAFLQKRTPAWIRSE
ncbi:enoyl-CoA hydratase/isomerase family protein [Rheinheimera sediminis]|uniref:enoyl-CoA hydratase/isomerase family protein n=1 Tax=Rheinheimera sp. YQF-1 TaxID=2499626 RepID=UPI000FD9615F|nr:enoyl-CoA hydratase/isomerase family protein [Rheinheimera sp. YQF-1]RVT45221.1 enoyl-CoA hydratase/isomerase family protein [Rheinheimera sp. YQF-1]